MLPFGSGEGGKEFDHVVFAWSCNSANGNAAKDCGELKAGIHWWSQLGLQFSSRCQKGKICKHQHTVIIRGVSIQYQKLVRY